MRGHELVSLALVRIRSGELPCADSPRLYAGAGRDERCGLCCLTIRPEDIEYEVTAGRLTGAPAASVFFHLPCYEAWFMACRQLPSTQRAAR